MPYPEFEEVNRYGLKHLWEYRGEALLCQGEKKTSNPPPFILLRLDKSLPLDACPP